jgi:hypothetical protein
MRSQNLSIKQLANRAFFTLACIFAFTTVKAQVPATAAAYPFTAYQGTFTPVTGGTQWFGAIGDDATQQNIPIGFSFPFTTGTYTTVSACSNGWLSLNNSGVTSIGNNTGSLNTIGGPVLMPLWDDLHMNYGGEMRSITTGTAPDRVFTIQWKGATWTYWVLSGTPGTTVVNVISFQVKLYESGVIEFVYSPGTDPIQTNSTPSATIGIARNSTDWKVLDNTSANPTPSSATFHDQLNQKPADGQVYLWGQIPCSGVPTTSIIGPDGVCPNKPFSLSLANMATFSGLSFQWQESVDNIVWTNFTGTGATSLTMSSVMVTPKYYRCIVTCSNSSLSFTTPAKYMGFADFYYCYCDNSKANSVQGMDIGNVKVITYTGNDTLLNNGNPVPFVNNATSTRVYTDFRYDVPVIPMYHDRSYRLLASQINNGSYTKGMAAIYIDQNRDGVFDIAERVLLDTIRDNSTPSAGLVTDTFKVSGNLPVGITGMRVIMQSNIAEPAPCGTYTEGETEDYLVDIRYHPCNGPLNAGTVTGEDTSMCVGYTYAVYDTTHEYKKHNISWSWELSPDGVVWVEAPNSSMKDSLTRVFTNTIYYRMRMICNNTFDTTRTAPFRIGLKPAYKCYCYSQSAGGTADSSDIGAFELNGYSVMTGGPHQQNPHAYRRRQDYTDLPPIELRTDRKYGLYLYHTMNVPQHGDAKITMFVDFNNNHKYDIPDERVGMWLIPGTNYYVADSLYIPDDAIVDVPTGLRVIVNNNVAPNIPSDEACGEYPSGETEDFIVIFRRPFQLGVENIDHSGKMALYPNPTSNSSMLQYDGKPASKLAITVTDITGRVVSQQQFSNTEAHFSLSLDMAAQARGIYMVTLQADGEKYMQKLIVK